MYVMYSLKTPKKPLRHFRTSRFDPMRSPRITLIRAWIFSVLIKLTNYFGVSVILLGPARSGKTYLLEKIVGEKIIDGRQAAKELNWRNEPALDLQLIPNGSFGIDEAQLFSAHSLSKELKTLSNRDCILCFQSFEQFKNLLKLNHRFLVLELK